MELETIMPNEIRQAKTNMPYEFTYMWNLKTNKPEIFINTENILENLEGEGGE